MNRRVAVRGIVVHNSKLLCFQLGAYDGKPAVDFWSVPGGGVDPGEGLIPALEREMIEETGIDYLAIDLSKTSHGQKEIAKLGFIDAAKETVLPEFLSRESFAELDQIVAPKIFNYL
jgi:8-oxo-dGTP pyrophosphatase MutT (NUDIX family)